MHRCQFGLDGVRELSLDSLETKQFSATMCMSGETLLVQIARPRCEHGTQPHSEPLRTYNHMQLYSFWLSRNTCPQFQVFAHYSVHTSHFRPLSRSYWSHLPISLRAPTSKPAQTSRQPNPTAHESTAPMQIMIAALVHAHYAQKGQRDHSFGNLPRLTSNRAQQLRSTLGSATEFCN